MAPNRGKPMKTYNFRNKALSLLLIAAMFIQIGAVMADNAESALRREVEAAKTRYAELLQMYGPNSKNTLEAFEWFREIQRKLALYRQGVTDYKTTVMTDAEMNPTNAAPEALSVSLEPEKSGGFSLRGMLNNLIATVKRIVKNLTGKGGNDGGTTTGGNPGGLPEPDKVIGVVKTEGGTLNIRDGVWGNKIGQLKDGQPIIILGREGEWYKVDYGTGTGFVHGAYVNVDGPGQVAPPVQPPSNPPVKPVSAQLPSTFVKTEVMPDSMFTDVNSMTQSQVQSFLEKKGSVLSKPYRGQLPSKMIMDAAKKYNISPKVLLATFQKEQGLISKSSVPESKLDWALGVGCYDSGNWNTKYKGLDKQIEYAASTYRTHFNAAQARYDAGDRTINMKIDGSAVPVTNSTTYALYKYTPHFAGNSLFYNVYKGYFGTE